MEQTKPYSLQSPEAIAKEYGGNKQKIAKAAQMGILDPTAAVVAGMFIDRMRSAASQEVAPQQTVAQEVMAPVAPGIAGLPAAQAMQQPAPQPQMDQATEGGLESLSVPESMYDYAGGGIVAFANGGYNDPEFLAATGLDNWDLGTDYSGAANADAGAAAEDGFEKRYKRELELRKKFLGDTGTTKEEAANLALIRAGLGIAGGKSQYALQNLAGAEPAVSQYAQDLKGIREGESKALEAAFKREADLEEKKLAAGKSTELDRAAAVFLRGLGAQGYDVNDPQVQASAYEMAFNAKGLTEYKGELSTAQGMQAKWELANKETNRILDNTKSGPGLEYFLATQRDAAAKKAGKPGNEAAAIRQRVMDEQLASLPDPTKPKGGMFKLPPLKKDQAGTQAQKKIESAKSGEVIVDTPSGKIRFKSAEDAEAFKKRAGLK